jgi:hypothetical protein
MYINHLRGAYFVLGSYELFNWLRNFTAFMKS